MAQGAPEKPSAGPSRTLKGVFIALCLALLLVIVSALLALNLFGGEAPTVSNTSESVAESRLFPIIPVNLTSDDVDIATTQRTTVIPTTSTTATTLLHDIEAIEEEIQRTTHTEAHSTPSTTSEPTTIQESSTTSTTTTATTTTSDVPATSTEVPTTTVTTTTSTTTTSTTEAPQMDNSESCAPRIQDPICRSTDFIPSSSVNPDQWEEVFVSSSGHLSGFRPLLYRINISVASLAAKSLAGSLDLRVECAADSDAIALHADRSIGEIDDVTLWNCRTGQEVCVKRTTHLLAQQIVIFELDTTVSNGTILELSIGTFQSRPQAGIHRNHAAKWERTRSSTLGTVFEMRNARKSFPCFDLPVFKAHMELCLTHPRGMHVRSNTPATVSSAESTCFGRTPKIASSRFAFSMFSKLYSYSRPAPSQNLPSVEVILRSKMDASSIDWVLNETITTVDKMREMTSVAPLEKLSVVVAPLPDALQGTENFGLVTIQESAIEYPNYLRSHSILAHEIIHQWVGDVVSVASWRDICLQEGLTVYLEWLITSQYAIADSNVDERCREAKANALFREVSKRTLVENFREIDQAMTVCSDKAPVIFHMLDSGFEPNLVERFLKLLFERFSWKSTTFDDWTAVLNEAAKTTLPGEMLTSYFTQPGYPLIHVNFRPNQALTISQRTVLGDFPSDNASMPFVVPLEIDDSSVERKTRFTVLKTAEMTEESPSAASWVVADPLAVTYSRVVYSVENYNGIASCVANKNCEFPQKVLDHVLGDFCWALLKDVFSTSDSETESWRAFLKFLSTSKAPSGDCGCCVDLANRNSRYCKWTWIDRCEKVSLLKSLTASPSRTKSRN